MILLTIFLSFILTTNGLKSVFEYLPNFSGLAERIQGTSAAHLFHEGEDKEHYGNPLKALFKPLTFSKNISLDQPEIKLFFHLSGTVYNATNIDITSYDIDPNLVRLAINVTHHGMKLDGSYDLDGIILKILPLTGRGKLKFKMDNFTFAYAAEFLPISGTLYLEKLEVLYDVQEVQVTVTGLSDDAAISDLLQEFIGHLVPSVLKEFRNQITDAIINYAFSKPNISKMSLNDFYDLVKMFI